MNLFLADNRPKQIPVPTSGVAHSFDSIDIPSHLIIVGANGAGKSRFAESIEYVLKSQGRNVLRISAQRAVSIPSETRLRALDEALKEVTQGNSYLFEQGGGIGRANRADRENSLVRVLSDFEAVLGLLFARTAKVYKDHYHRGDQKTITPIERLGQFWTALLPERELVFNEDKMTIDVKINATGSQFHTSKMSDGERAALYLLSQCLSAESGSVIIIDEPELHIHRSLVNSMFSNLQLDRPDCLFIYVTHDLEFASGQPNARKIWLQKFHYDSWTWTFAPEAEALPERLLLEVLGARKPVLFVEGGSTSDDRKVYDILFPKMNVIPCGSCDQVVKAVGVLRQNNNLTHMSAYGLIDRDFKDDSEIANLSEKGVYALKVAEVENLFATEEVIDILAKTFSSGQERALKAKEIILHIFSEQIDRQIADGATFRLRSQLGAIARPSQNGKSDFVAAFQSHISSVSPDHIYEDTRNRFQVARDSKSVREILRVFNMKKLRFAVGSALGVQPDLYLEKTMSMLQASASTDMKEAFKAYIPDELKSFMSS